MDFEYIIVQAGGKGTRMGKETKNKPKALVPIDNLPMLFHLFQKYPGKKFMIIGDYKYEVLEKYLKVFATVDYQMINADGRKGTCGGLQQALSYIPAESSFLLIWSDIILDKTLVIEDLDIHNYVGLTFQMPCRWKFQNGVFIEEKSEQFGVAGVFLFENKSYIDDVPIEGEFVRYLSHKNIEFYSFDIRMSDEFGLIEKYNQLKKKKCRPFNRITEFDEYIIKEGIDEKGLELAKNEQDWYYKAKELGVKNIPQIYEINPLKLERIKGKNIYEYDTISYSQKKEILKRLVDCLKELHLCGSINANCESLYDAYVGKTFDRLEKIKDLIPFAEQQKIVINGKECKNVFFYKSVIEEKFKRYHVEKFVFIHGDCTFSNILLKNDKIPILIDPRGYFGYDKYYGDVAYDWAKLYYSLVGNYDQFNLKQFDLSINDEDVQLEIKSSHWEDMELYFFELLKDDVDIEIIKLIHSIIWLSLTTYAWEDYDSICGAFYNGLLYLNELI